MKDSPPAVLRWPAPVDKSRQLLIVAVNTEKTPIRENARQRVRQVLREILSDVEFISIPGQPIRPADANSPLGISVSHESGLSLIAINQNGRVGIDLLQIPESPDWLAQAPSLASDYLGPTIASEIAALPLAARLPRFSQAWAEQEARLKCCGLALTEWSAVLETKLAACHLWPLALPEGYAGAVATLKSGEIPSA